MNDKLKIDLQRVLQVFTQNEMGNKVTQFNMMGLTNMLIGVIDGTVVVKQQAPQGGQMPQRPVETHRVDLPEPKKEEAPAPKKLEDLEPKPEIQAAEVAPEPETQEASEPAPEEASEPAFDLI